MWSAMYLVQVFVIGALWCSVSGDNVNTLSVQCGSTSSPPVITEPDIGNLTSPNYPGNYPTRLSCAWLLDAGIDRAVYIQFNDFCTYGSDYVYIYNGPNSGYPRLLQHSGCSLPPTVMSTSNQVVIYFYTGSYYSYRGFHLTYRFRDNCGSPSLPVEIQSEPFGSLTSPSPYSANSSCAWRFTADSGLGVHIEFPEFCTRQGSDFMRAYDGTSVYHRLLAEHSGCEPPNDITSSGRAMLVTFTSTDGQEQGFKMTWDMTEQGYCGQYPNPIVLTSSSGRLTSPNYPSAYENNNACAWLIVADQQQGVTLEFHDFCTQSCCDHVRVYDGNSTLNRQLMDHSGCSNPPSVTSSGRSLLIDFTTDQSYTQRGFNMSWQFNATSCGSSDSPLMIYQPSSNFLTSPNYPDNYDNNLACVWILVAPAGQVVSVEINDICTESCCDRLSFYDANTTHPDYLIYAHAGCQSPSPRKVVSTLNSILITFATDGSVTDRGFRLTWEFTTSVCGTSSLPLLVNGTSGVITSPNYPSKYPHTLDCVWQLNAEPGKIITARFTDMCTEECCDLLSFYGAHNRSEEVSIAKHSGCSGMFWGVATDSNQMSITFTTDRSINMPGFNITWEVMDSACGHPDSPILLTDGQNGSFATPNYPYNHPTNLECGWLIRGKAGQVVEAWFEDMCTIDFVTGYDGETTNSEVLFDMAGCMYPPPSGITSTANSMLITFKTETPIQERGFHFAYGFNTK